MNAAKLHNVYAVTLVFLLSFLLICPLRFSAKTWCVSDPSATDAQLKANIDWACSEGKVSCVIIGPGGPCYEPNTFANHASFVMNDYYQNHGGTEEACDFNHTGRIVSTNPSYGGCVFT
ncbi:PREDICTED: major pollen allergen Ole e 10-like [Camelina sativa]|uniref:Major pollen allergen Ole e 10-like n=1 Tax=Camelina sativa TaxID=90675 RepID=A0ABM1Q788_CAMSA|nr:PREDICTED: major pollen allergen Ole e 10-like [Camelina sativa]